MTVHPDWPPPAVPSAPPRRVRWGLGDVIWVWFAAIAVSVVAAGMAAAFSSDPERPTGWNILVGTVAQNGAVVLALLLVARTKGVGSLRADFGLRIRLRDWWWGLVGVGISVGTGALLVPVQRLLDESPSQEVVRIIDRSSGAAALAGALAVAIAAPIGEELLFRGALLRSLQRRFRPVVAIGVSSVVFALVHPLLDPSAVLALVPLLVLSVVCGIVAVRGGDLSRSIWLHAGFNTITAIWLIAS